jgi:hypothetical protein
MSWIEYMSGYAKVNCSIVRAEKLEWHDPQREA